MAKKVNGNAAYNKAYEEFTNGIYQGYKDQAAKLNISDTQEFKDSLNEITFYFANQQHGGYYGKAKNTDSVDALIKSSQEDTDLYTTNIKAERDNSPNFLSTGVNESSSEGLSVSSLVLQSDEQEDYYQSPTRSLV